MQRTDLLDTSEWAHKEMVRQLKELTPEQRLAMAIERSEFLREWSRRSKEQIDQDLPQD